MFPICLEIEGVKEAQQGQLVADVVEHTLYKLLPRRRNPIILDINIVPKENMGDAVGFAYEDAEDFHVIELSDELLEDKDYLIETLCHELVHVKQAVKGELKDANQFIKLWKGEEHITVFTNYENYRDLPWEEEAYRLQDELKADYYKKTVA